MARAVSFSASPAYREDKRPSKNSGPSPPRGISSWTSIFVSVMVPVLSAQSTSTRARVSMEFMSWTRTFRPAKMREDTAMATLVSRYSPSGIMPTKAATMDSMEVLRPRSSFLNCW